MPAPPQRLDAIDSAKGIGIVLVVFGHAWRGARGAGLLADEVLFRFVDAAVYAFHMPLFFFLSGLLFLEALQKHSAQTLLPSRVTRLLWPMALWSWIFFAFKLAAGEAANAPVSLTDFPLIPLPPYEHLWFLWALFLCQSLVILAYPAFGARLPVALLRYGLGATAILLALLNPYTPVPSLIWGPMVEHMPYFLAGIAAGGLASVRPGALTGVLFGLLFVGGLALVAGERASVLHSLLLVVVGWYAWSALDRHGEAAGPVVRLLRRLGRASMVIYLTHTVFSAGLRILLVGQGIDDLTLILFSTVAIGIVVPVIFGDAARRLGLAKLLGF